MVHDMFRRSATPAGDLHFGMTVTNSCFHTRGQMCEAEISLYMSHNGTASSTANLWKREGKTSPRTIDFGFLKMRIRVATSCGLSGGMDLSCVLGMSSGSRGWNSALMRLKNSASSSATSSSDRPGNNDRTSNCYGLSFDLKALTFRK